MDGKCRHIGDIDERHNVIQVFLEQWDLTGKLSKMLTQTGDLERLVSRAAAGRLTPRGSGFQLKTALEDKLPGSGNCLLNPRKLLPYEKTRTIWMTVWNWWM